MVHFQGSELLNQFASLLKRGCSKMKEFVPLKTTPVQKWLGVQECKQEVTTAISLVKKKKILPGVYSSLNFDDKTCNDFYSSIWEHNTKD